MTAGTRQDPSSAAAKTRAAREHYDRWSTAYGRSRLLPSLQRKALAELSLREDDRLLDVACGAGAVVVQNAPLVARAVGIDLSEGMLDLARRRLAELPEPDHPRNVDFLQGSSDALPFDGASFTALICTTALHHFPDPQSSISEMARVLEPGGRLVIGDASRDALVSKLADPLFRRFEDGHVGLQRKRDIEAMLEHAGLRVVSSRHVWLRLYAIVRADRRPSG